MPQAISTNEKFLISAPEFDQRRHFHGDFSPRLDQNIYDEQIPCLIGPVNRVTTVARGSIQSEELIAMKRSRSNDSGFVVRNFPYSEQIAAQ
jgi:hypothetical protein